MKIDKISFKNHQAWLAIYSKDRQYLGTWHVTNPEFVEVLRNKHPRQLKLQ